MHRTIPSDSGQTDDAPSLKGRREFLKQSAAGFGYLAFAGIANRAAAAERADRNPLDPKETHFPAKAKRVIFLYMDGAPSHIDTFDYKPQLLADDGKPGQYGGTLFGSPFKFSQHGNSGAWISELFPSVAQHADDLALIRSMHCDQPAHPSAMVQMHTGSATFIRPSLGSWVVYGLGTENNDMPGFLSLNPPSAGAPNYNSAFLPSVYTGARLGRGSVRQVGNQTAIDIANPRLTRNQQRRQIDFIQQLNRGTLDQSAGSHRNIEGVIESFELGYRMQDSMPELMDISRESAETLQMYGIGNGASDGFGKQCLMARRFVESGVRFVEISYGSWDHHSKIATNLPTRCTAVDQPIAGLLQDLKNRDLLRDTLVIWGGEFGRTPYRQGGDGRNHNNKGYTLWMAGGGVKGGMSYGATDEYGYEAVENPVHIHDWHATILHLLGLDHEQLTYRHAGRDFRLTDVHGNVVHDIIS
ncbi:MAG: DUF1501 domain-containing protein [Planctomycetota bacterium]